MLDCGLGGTEFTHRPGEAFLEEAEFGAVVVGGAHVCRNTTSVRISMSDAIQFQFQNAREDIFTKVVHAIFLLGGRRRDAEDDEQRQQAHVQQLQIGFCNLVNFGRLWLGQVRSGQVEFSM